MTSWKYPLATDTWDEDEYQAIMSVLESRKFSMGVEVAHFQSEFASFFGSKYGVMSNSGSSANLLAAAAMRYTGRHSPHRRDVIVPAVSWSTTYFPLSQLGYRLKFIDVELETLNAPATGIEDAIDEGTAGIMVVNLLGNPSELSRVRRIADDYGLFMIEDNCESLGASFEGQYAGTFGDVGTFSSYFSHHISTMEGGISLTSSLEMAEAMLSLRAHGWTRDLPDQNTVFDKTGDDFEDLFRFVLPGYNLRPLEIEGAIGRQQIKKIDSILTGRKENARLFLEVLAEFPEIITQREIGESSWFGFSMILSGRLANRRKDLINILTEEGIQSRPIVAGNFTRNPVIQHLEHTIVGPLSTSDIIHDRGLFIGNHHYLLEEELEHLGRALRRFLKVR